MRPAPRRPRALLVPAVAAVGLLALAGCSTGGDGGTPGPSQTPVVTTTAPAAPGTGSPSSGSASTLPSLVPASKAPSGAVLPQGTRAYAVDSLTWGGDPVPTGPWESVAIETDAPFQLVVTQLCGQPRVDVVSVAPGTWQAQPSDAQPAVACLPEAETAQATEAVWRLFEGTVTVDAAADGTLTLRRADVALVLTPQG